MPGLILLAYLIVLVVLPLLARWRWGLVASLAVVILELAFVFTSHRLMIDYGFLPLELPDPPRAHPKAQITDYHVASFARDLGTQILPALATLTGGVLSVVWSVSSLLWRAAGKRKAGGGPE